MYYNDNQNDYDGYYNGIYDYYDPFYTEDNPENHPTPASNGCCCCFGLVIPCLVLPPIFLMLFSL